MSREEDLKTALATHKPMLSCIGVWPLKRTDLFANFRFAFAVLVQATLVNLHLIKIYLHCGGTDEALRSLTPSLASILALTRLIVLRVHRKDLLLIVTTLVADWRSEKDTKMRDIMKNYVRLSRRVTILTSILVMFVIVHYIFIVVTMAMKAKSARNDEFHYANASSDAKNETEAVCVFDAPTVLRIFNILQALQMIITGIVTAGSTSFFFALAMHICGQFDVLSASFEARRSSGGVIIADVVRRHCHLVKLADCLENSFNVIVLVYLFVTATLMCVEGFLIILFLKLGAYLTIVHRACVLVLMLVQFSFYTVAGEYLEMKSISLSNAIYGYDWPERPSAVTKDLTLILMRASIPHRLTAGKFVSLNMVTFKDILKSTASYLSVLRVMMGV